jgi:hypothetical protein
MDLLICTCNLLPMRNLTHCPTLCLLPVSIGISHGMYPSRVSLRHLSQNKCVTSRNQVYTYLLQVVYMSVELALLYAFLFNYGIVRRYMRTDLQYSLLTLRRLLVSMETSVAPKSQGSNWIQWKEIFG